MPVSTAQPRCSREFGRQPVNFPLSTLRSFDSSELLGLRQLVPKLGEPAPIGHLRLPVEHVACVAKAGDMNAGNIEFTVERKSSRFLSVRIGKGSVTSR